MNFHKKHYVVFVAPSLVEMTNLMCDFMVDATAWKQFLYNRIQHVYYTLTMVKYGYVLAICHELRVLV